MFYLQDMGKETATNEYKQPVLHTLVDEQKAIDIIEKKKTISNTIIFKELTLDMNKYFPKYLCSFLNTNIDGKLFYGVNDYGEVIGFPWKGELTYHKRTLQMLLKNQINKILFSNKILSNMDKNYIFNECFNISIIQLDKKKSLQMLGTHSDIAMELYNKWVDEKKRYNYSRTN